MSLEVVKYRPENIVPEEFMRPPTEILQPAVIDLCYEFEKRINKKIAKIASPFSLVKHSSTLPRLKMGSELEILLFSGNADPSVNMKQPETINPNYNKTFRKN